MPTGSFYDTPDSGGSLWDQLNPPERKHPGSGQMEVFLPPPPMPAAPHNSSGNLEFFQNLNAPQQELLNQQRQRLMGGQAHIDAGLSLDKGALQDRYDTDLASLGIDRQQLGLKGKDLAAQLGAIEKYRAFAGQSLAAQLRGFDISETGANQAADRNRFQLGSNLTARGAFNTVARGRGMTDIQNDLTNQLGQIDVGRDQANIGYNKELTGLDLQKIQTQNAQQGLSLASQQLGISETRLKNELNTGMEKLGLKALVDTDALWAAINGVDQQQAALARDILTAVAGASGSGLDLSGLLGQKPLPPGSYKL